MLTYKMLQKLKPGTYSDGGGLYMRVSPKGKRSWLIREQLGGKNNARVIGTYPQMSLAQARSWEEQAKTLTTDEAIRRYVAKLNVVRPDHVEQIMKWFPDLYADRRILVDTLQEKAKTSPVMANRMLTRWKDFLSFCLQQGWVTENVLEPVQRRFIGGKENSRNRVLDWEEMKGVTDPTMLYILLTGLRSSEAIYSLIYSKTKGIPTKRVDYKHDLPKSHLIYLFIKKAAKGEFKLPSSHLTLSNKLRRGGATYRPHDLRRTFATRLSDLAVAPHIIEKLLGHKMPGVMAVYNHAEYWPERNAAQRLWDKKLIALWRSASS